LLFLQLIMRRLRRTPARGRLARAAVIVPNGTLYEDGVPARIREELLTQFALHTVVRLPKGVFEPYADIATNILFFDRDEAVTAVWFYEHPLPPRRAHLKGKKYSATDGIRFEEFDPLLRWWPDRQENEFAWKVSVGTLRESGWDLAQIHPKHARLAFADPVQVIQNVRRTKDESELLLRGLEDLLASVKNVNAPPVELNQLISARRSTIAVQDDELYVRPRVQLHFRGCKIRD